MIVLDQPPLLLPAPAIFRPAEHALLHPGAFRPCTKAERRAIIADLLRTGRITPDQVALAIMLVPIIGWSSGLTVSFLTFARTETSSFVMPTIQANDISIVINYAKATFGAIPEVIPSGHTKVLETNGAVGSGDGPDIAARISWKKLVGSESGVNFNVMTGFGTHWEGAVCMIFRPSSAANPTFFDPSANWANVTPVDETISAASAATTPVIVVGGSGANDGFGGGEFSNVTPAFDAEIGSDTSSPHALMTGYKIYNPGTTPSNVVIEGVDWGTDNWLGGIYCTLAAA